MSGSRHTLVTPEGAELHFASASGAERLIAFAIDMAVLIVGLLVFGLVLGALFGPAPVLLGVFFARLLYFAWQETHRNGSTIGKRRLNLRVIRADGGPLTTEVVLARNLTREVEIFLPLQIVLMPDAYYGDHSGTIAIVGSIWVLLLLLFPLTNRDRLRIGDLLAGTRVVVAPVGALLRDLADQPASDPTRSRRRAPVFSTAQLDVYGIKEIEVLEDVLRKARTPGAKETIAAVARSIRKRIDWHDSDGRRQSDYAFLRGFYIAQRRHLENRLLLGQRREHKRS